MNVCECPYPPGGTITCPSDCLAICRVVNNQAVGECIPRPPKLTLIPLEQGLAEANWILGAVTGQVRSLSRAITAEEWAIIESGSFENAATGERVTFRVPPPTGFTPLAAKGKYTPPMAGKDVPARAYEQTSSELEMH